MQETAPLFHNCLLHAEPGPGFGTAFHARPLKVDDRIREFLLGSDALDPRLMRLSKTVAEIAPPSSQQACVEELRERLARGECDSFNLTGPADCGKLLVAREIYRGAGRRLMSLDPQRLPPDAGEREETLRIAARSPVGGARVFHESAGKRPRRETIGQQVSGIRRTSASAGGH